MLLFSLIFYVFWTNSVCFLFRCFLCFQALSYFKFLALSLSPALFSSSSTLIYLLAHFRFCSTISARFFFRGVWRSPLLPFLLLHDCDLSFLIALNITYFIYFTFSPTVLSCSLASILSLSLSLAVSKTSAYFRRLFRSHFIFLSILFFPFFFQNNVMPNGEANITNSVLEMMHADRHTVGHYKCTADNRVGQPDIREIFVNVLCKYISQYKSVYMYIVDLAPL